MTKRPNFLVIMTDQQRSDWLGCYGHPVVKTPNIDSIADKGVRFTNFHTASPVCMPNRASFMTGRMPSVHGLRYNGCNLSRSANTFVDVLAESGYRTASIGKSHLQEFTGWKSIWRQDEKERLIEEAWSEDGADYLQEDPVYYPEGQHTDFQTPYYGFQHVDMVTGHSVECGGHYRQWLQSNYPEWANTTDEAGELPHNYTCPQSFRTPMPEEAYPSAYIGNQATDWLAKNAGAEDPFFLFVSFPDPHHPFTPPGKYWDMYSPDQFEVEIPYEAHKNPTPIMEWIHNNFVNGGGQLTRQTATQVSEQELKEAMALSAGMLSMVDDQIGRVLQALEDSGELDNTVIVFTTDHGDYLGDFGMLLKGAMPFRAITQSPLIWSDPDGRHTGTMDSMASTIDLGPSILDRAGLTPFRGTQGVSFVDAMNDGREHRDAILIEYNDGTPRTGLQNPARVRALRTKEWRFTIYGGESWGELYDLLNDPHETHNLWDSEEHAAIKAELSLRLNHILTAQMDESPTAQYMA